MPQSSKWIAALGTVIASMTLVPAGAQIPVHDIETDEPISEWLVLGAFPNPSLEIIFTNTTFLEGRRG